MEERGGITPVGNGWVEWNNREEIMMEGIRRQAECGRYIRWFDVSNPTPFMLAVLLFGIGWILGARGAPPVA
jgi:hypothetical protein